MTDDLIKFLRDYERFCRDRGQPSKAAMFAKAITALVAAEARERERCAKVRVAAPSEAPGRLDYYTFKRGWDAGISAKNAAIRKGGKP